ncbi:AAA family ATPase [Aestuariicoccus sp. MJ-SS9]|uniref:AAA family ATPase n=1 Tax=Aestuariicoccus sp. MJ-SS9 TaxID=3079855 RepID=UPI002909B387|nr:AAA family ATPase [Aestuariicoccus sp. MJ-SS9]MDU8913281.1 AAA family ATPase [Aestuariicoccus sp. MJ-SS9]
MPLSTSPKNLPAHDPPAWFDELASAGNYARHLVLSGNIRDIFPTVQGAETTFADLFGVVRRLLSAQGIETLLIYDPVAGLRCDTTPSPDVERLLKNAELPLGRADLSLPELARVHLAVSQSATARVALIMDYASHLGRSDPEERDRFFVQIDKNTRERQGAEGSGDIQNPTIWMVDESARVPHWFGIGNTALREIHVELPNLEDRFLYAGQLVDRYGLGCANGDAPDHDKLQQFALGCDGETLLAMRSIAKVARAEGISLARISDAIRVYRTGMRRNPWNSKVLADRVRMAKDILGRRIKGQQAAIDKTTDILARSIVGLSGSQSGSRQLKPRGILFLAGPTGVGKTELAKAVTELLFGDEAACHRFDMSEFMEETAVSRLVGAPPGHPGHERGGELVNAAHRRPFSVFLFDEVEKAHPRTLDVFLQILDDGRLTDSRGSTAHFSESLIIFTSNIGTVKESRVSNMGMNVLPSDSHEELALKIGRSIEDHFRVRLQRPELLNRIGQNIIVFDFLSAPAAQTIFGAIIERVLEAVRIERGITVTVGAVAFEKLQTICTENFFEGGRGIGNRIERHFINSLAREIFENDIQQDFTVVDATIGHEKTTLEIEPLA